MIYILGSEGFVGSAFRRWCERQNIPYAGIDVHNYADYVGTACDVFVNANGNSKKYLAEREPLTDFDMNVRTTLKSVLDFSAGLYVYLSTIDVYNDVSNPAHNAEDTAIQLEKLSRYAFGKYMGEWCVRYYAPAWLVVRLGGMVGPGLKKNPIYDIVHGIPLRVSPHSAYQYLHTDDVADVVMGLVNQNRQDEFFNLCGNGAVPLTDVLAMAGKPIVKNNLEAQRYDVNIVKVNSLFDIPCTMETLSSFILASRPSPD